METPISALLLLEAMTAWRIVWPVLYSRKGPTAQKLLPAVQNLRESHFGFDVNTANWLKSAEIGWSYRMWIIWLGKLLENWTLSCPGHSSFPKGPVTTQPRLWSKGMPLLCHQVPQPMGTFPIRFNSNCCKTGTAHAGIMKQWWWSAWSCNQA